MTKGRIGKKIVAWLMCLVMVMTIANLLAFTTEVKAEEPTPTPLTFTAEKDGSTISLTWLEGSEVQYSTNGDENWNNYTEGESITLTNKGDTVSFKGKNVKTGYCYNESEGTEYYKKFVMKGKISASGDVTSLTNAKGGDVALEAGCYDSMFDSCDSLTSAPNLPSTTLADSCYSYMFYECTSLADAPTLGATILADNCYKSMFEGCKNLSSAPALPATTLAESCYNAMFYGCTSLSNAPALSATTLAEGCYQGMFYECMSLKVVETEDESEATWKFPQTELTNWNVAMIAGLIAPGTLNAVEAGKMYKVTYSDVRNFVDQCNCLTFTAEEDGSTVSLTWIGGSDVQYSKDGDSSWHNYTAGTEIMLNSQDDTVSFKGTGVKTDENNHFSMKGKIAASGDVTSLTNGVGGDTTLEAKCYQYMFKDCTSLTSAPSLPATTLAGSCYYCMFQGCTSLTSAPSLPATTLADSCYSFMFAGCTNLSSAPELPATTLAEYCYSSMFSGCTSLTGAPELKATTLAERCYADMFHGCENLKLEESSVGIWEFPSTVSAVDWNSMMIYGTGGSADSVEAGKQYKIAGTEVYSITYKMNGGSWADGYTAPNCYVAGTGRTLPTISNISKKGNDFEGWYDNAEFSGSAITSIDASANANKTYYAKWHHNHGAWTYSAENNTLKATCGNLGCSLPESSVSLTFTTSSSNHTGSTTGWCEAGDIAFALEGTDDWASVVDTVPTIHYTGITIDGTAYSGDMKPTEDGGYTAYIECDGQKVELNFNVGHIYEGQAYEVDEDGIHHNQQCKYCGYVDQRNHDFIAGDGTCKTDVEACDSCGAKNIAYTGLDIKATTTAYNGTEQTAVITGIDAANYEVTGNKATNAGKHTITLTGKGDYAGTREVEWTINPKELTPSITGIATKVYDGTTTVPEENTLAIALAGMCGEDDVSASATSYAYADKNAAEEKNVVASGITLSGAAKDNYKVVATVTTKVGKITKATPAYTNPTDLTGVCGKTLSTVTLPAGFEWSDDTTAKLEAVSSEASSVVTKKAKYVPTDATNYSEVENISIDIIVSHDLKAESNGDGTHSGKCQNCSYKAIAESCSGGTATCVKKAECEVCGAEYGSYGAHTGNTEIKNAKEATCEETGYTGDTYCKDCEIKLESGTEVQAKGHDMTRTVSAEVPATCHSEGATAVIGCSRCSHTEGGETIAKTAHTIKAVAEVPATCKATGTKAHYVCETDGCDKKFADAEGKTEITDATTLVIEKDLRKHTGETEIKNAKEATCKEPGYSGDTYCKDCGAKLESGSETNQLKPHKYDEGTVTKKATCTEDGVLTKKCSVCDAETTEVIKATGHTEVVDKAVAPTCTKDGLTEGKHCSECNAVLIKQETVKATGHNWDNGKVTKEPTVSAEGVKTFTCTNPGCNETKTEAIAKLPEPKKNEVIEDKTVTKITIPSTVTTIGKDAFKGCIALKKITLPKQVVKIGANAFNGCKKLKTIIIKSTKLTDKSVAKNAFKGLSKNTVIKVPKKKLKAYKKLFKKKGFKGKVKTI